MNPHHWKVDFMSTIWIIMLVVAVVLNAAVVVLVQSLAYRIDDPYAHISEAYPGYTILDTSGIPENPGYLLQSSTGEVRLVVMEQFLSAGRYRVIPKGTQVLAPEETAFDTTVLGNMGNVRITVHNRSEFETFRPNTMGFHIALGQTYLTIPSMTIVFAAGLLIAEVALWLVLRKVLGKA